MKMLIVDDEKTNCKLMELYVLRWGYEPIIFWESKKAYEYLLQTDEPIVACVDWMMPEMDGIEICEKIRKERPDFPIYIILLTAKSGKESLIKGLDAGADDYITKPFDAEELKSRIGAGKRVVDLEKKLIEWDRELENANDALKRSIETIEKDVKAGRAIQNKLLPENNQTILNFKFSHYLEPSLYLSGDFLDYFKINDQFVGFYFIDVSGHGASSAFITILIKSYISSFISKNRRENDNTILDPKNLIRIINKLLLKEKLGKHLTIFYGLIDNINNKLIFSNAGQFPFPILFSHGTTEFLNEKGFPVGLIKNSQYKNYEKDLPKDFTLFLLSDGFLDILPISDLKLQQEFLLSTFLDDSITIDDIPEKFGLESIKEFPDDITCLIIKSGDSDD